jgi:hypothetical protein
MKLWKYWHLIRVRNPNTRYNSRLTQVCLAMEEGEKEGVEKARHLIEKFLNCFHIITLTNHPRDTPREIRGKSSNTAWAAKEMLEQSGTPSPHEIITVMDADTCFASDYFEALSYHYAIATEQERAIMFFSPTIVFDRYFNFF